MQIKKKLGIYETIPVVWDKKDAGQTHDQLQSPPGGLEVSQTGQDDHANGIEGSTHRGHKFPVVWSKELNNYNKKIESFSRQTNL